MTSYAFLQIFPTSNLYWRLGPMSLNESVQSEAIRQVHGGPF